MRSCLTLLLTTLAVVLPAAAQRAPQLALSGLDPVALIAGREVPGQDGLAVVRGNYRYRFADEGSRARFLADPARHEIQLGGGCGRMGPLSGVGDPRRFHVHESRIYIFASDQCRSAFRKKPAVFLDPDDAPVQGTPEQLARGRSAIEAAAQAHGGARLDAIEGLVFVDHATSGSSGRVYRQETTTAVAFPDRFHRTSDWDEGTWVYTDVVHGQTGFFAEGNAVDRTMAPIQRRAVFRREARRPLYVLRARTADDFRAAWRGRARRAGLDIDLVDVSFGGTTTAVGLDPATQRIVYTAARRPGPSMWYGRLETVYSDHRSVGGVVVPFGSRTRFDGKWTGTAKVHSSVSAGPVDDALFAEPKGR